MTTSVTKQPGSSNNLDNVRRNQIDLVYDSSVYAVVVMAAVALLLYIYITPEHAIMNYWLLAIVLAACFQLLFTWRFLCARKSGTVNYKKAEYLLFLGTAMSGLTWGNLGILVLPEVEAGTRLVIVGVLAGISAGSIAILSYRYMLAVMFIVLLMLPMIIIGLVNETTAFAPIMILVIFTLFLINNARVFYNNTVEMLRLKTESMGRGDELLLLRRKVEQANLAKSAFLANMSHELRTPMHAILGFSDLGASKAGKATAEKTASYFNRIHDSGQRLLRLLDNLLDLSKLESGRMMFEFTRQDLQSTIGAVIVEFDLAFREHNLTVEVEPSGLDTVAVYDQKKISQVVRNLLSNAIRYTPDGVTIGIYFEESELTVDENDASAVLQPAISISIVDQGPGIPQEELKTVFDKFVQSSKTSTGAGGTGLGLSICKEIITHHGGKIMAENGRDGGAVFTFTIPCNGPLDIEIAS